MLGVVKNLIGKACLDDMTALHDHHPMGQHTHNGKIMRDYNYRQPQILNKRA